MSLQLAGALLAQRRYAPIWTAQTLGAFNDNLFRYALVTMAAYQGLSVAGLPPEQMAPVAATVFTVPLFLFSALAGQIADRFDRTRIMRVTKFAEIFLMLMAAAGFILGNPFLLLGALFLTGVQTAFFVPARNSAMPTLLAPHELVTANALLSGAINVAILAGAIGGTLMVAAHWGPQGLGLTLVSCAVFGWLAMRQGVPAPASNPGLKIRWNIFVETWRILSLAISAREVLRPLLGVAWFWMLAAAVVTALPVFTRMVLGGDPSVVALFQFLFTIGAALGALICGVMSRGGDAIGFTVAGAFGLVLFPADLALYTMGAQTPETLIDAAAFAADPANRRILIGLTGAAVSAGMFVVPLQAMVQRRAAPELRGRILAAGGVLNGLAASLGQFVLIALALVSAPAQGVFIFIAAGSLGAALFALWRLSRRGKSATRS